MPGWHCKLSSFEEKPLSHSELEIGTVLTACKLRIFFRHRSISPIKNMKLPLPSHLTETHTSPPITKGKSFITMEIGIVLVVKLNRSPP